MLDDWVRNILMEWPVVLAVLVVIYRIRHRGDSSSEKRIPAGRWNTTQAEFPEDQLSEEQAAGGEDFSGLDAETFGSEVEQKQSRTAQKILDKVMKLPGAAGKHIIAYEAHGRRYTQPVDEETYQVLRENLLIYYSERDPSVFFTAEQYKQKDLLQKKKQKSDTVVLLAFLLFFVLMYVILR